MSEMPSTLSVVIPTYGREAVLVDTLEALLALDERADEIVVVDQTPNHRVETRTALESLEREGRIRWIRLEKPSIPGAMNRGLLEATGEIVLFLDDDIFPGSDLVSGHRSAHADGAACLVAGQVLQPGEVPLDAPPGEEFRFCSTRRQWVGEFPGGNFSVRREDAVRLGGFDEQFVRVAYRFEREFADRLVGSGGRILFEPSASIRHLRAPSGGTRAFGSHLTTMRPSHAVGAYYYILASPRARRRTRNVLRSLLRGVITRFHLRHPWWILPSIVAQVSGLAWAIRLRVQGPRLLGHDLGGAAR